VKKNIKVEVIHNASIINAVGCTGLQVYRFGETVSIPFFTENWRPYSFYQKIAVNRKNNQHTLLLLDIRVKEKTPEALFKGKLPLPGITLLIQVRKYTNLLVSCATRPVSANFWKPNLP